MNMAYRPDAKTLISKYTGEQSITHAHRHAQKQENKNSLMLETRNKLLKAK